MFSTFQRRRLQRILLELRWRRYRDNPEQFFAECLWVPAGAKLGGMAGRARLELFDYQRDALQKFQSERYLVILKARQLGLTTITMAYALHHILFRPGANVVLVSKNQTTANKALELLDFMWDFLPGWVRDFGPTLESNAATSHQWRHPDGMTSSITSYAATKTVAAGQTATLVVWDEAALAEHQDEVLRTLMPTTDAGGQMLVFSTARGGYNTFAALYRGAMRNENEFSPLFYPWYVSRLLNPSASMLEVCGARPCDKCVDRTLYEQKRQSMTSKPWQFFAEYPEEPDEAFRQSGRSRFGSLPPLEEYRPFEWRGRIVRDGSGMPVLVEDLDGPLRLREDALDGTPAGLRAALAVDPATGAGGDYTAMTVGWFDETGVPQRVGFWHANDIEPGEASEDAALIGEFFADNSGRPALLAVEKQGGYGDTFIRELREHRGYTNLYVHTYTGHRARRRETTFGFPMSYARRPLVIDLLAHHILGKDVMELEGIDPMLRFELGTFVVREDGKVTADTGCYDDLVMSCAIWIYVASEVAPTQKATADVKSEDEGRAVFSVAHIFDEAEQVRVAEEKMSRRREQRFENAIRRRR